MRGSGGIRHTRIWVMIYLDHAATTAMYPEAIEKMLPFLGKRFYNPSGNYEEGTNIHREIERVRKELAESIHGKPQEIFFTSGGTESDNWALVNAVRNGKQKGKHIITTRIEHHAVLHTCQFLESQGYELTYLPVNDKGILEMDTLKAAIRPDTVLISVMYANNEVGTLQPVSQIGALARERGILFHTDAVQAYGHLPIDVEKENIDFMSVSAHKFGGPKGTGFLYARDGLTLTPFIFGGSQEKKRRAGTENVAGIIGMGEAARISEKYRLSHFEKEKKLRDYLMGQILSEIQMARLNGSASERLPGNLNISFRHVVGQSLIMMLEMNGIYVSGGSACTASDKAPSHVLTALGLSEDMAGSAVRITVGYENTMNEMRYVFRCIQEAVEELRNM